VKRRQAKASYHSPPHTHPCPCSVGLWLPKHLVKSIFFPYSLINVIKFVEILPIRNLWVNKHPLTNITLPRIWHSHFVRMSTISFLANT
jgi:hypothetical protein